MTRVGNTCIEASPPGNSSAHFVLADGMEFRRPIEKRTAFDRLGKARTARIVKTIQIAEYE